MIKILIGDLFKSEMQVLVNTVNCEGVMGKGIALIFKKRYHEMFEDYEARCERNEVKPGVPFLYENPILGYKVINFPTKKHWRASTRVADIERGLEHFKANYQEWGIKSAAFPPLGCGNGGLRWSTVGPLMYTRLSKLDMPIEIYAPHGTPAEQLSDSFLSGGELKFADRGVQLAQLRDEWVAITEIIHRIESASGKAVTRAAFHTICYLATALGMDVGLRFKASSYLPETRELREMINVLANRNWLLEERRGTQFVYRSGLDYRKSERSKLPKAVWRFEKKIEKITQLFEKPSSVMEAELIAAVIFHIQCMRKDPTVKVVSFDNLRNHICEIKKAWQKPEASLKVEATIINLQERNWIKIDG